MAKYFILEHFSFLSKLQKILSIYSWATLQSTLSTYCVKSVQTRRFFWSVFSCIWTEYGDILGKLPYSAQIQDNTDQKNLCIWTLFKQRQSWRVLKTRCKVTGQLRKAPEETWVLQGEKDLPCCFFIWTKFNGAQVWKLYQKSTKENSTVQKLSKYGVFSGPYFSVFGLNTEK